MISKSSNMLKINTFQNLTQYLVYFKEYINIYTFKSMNLFYSKYLVKKWKINFTQILFLFFKTSDPF